MGPCIACSLQRVGLQVAQPRAHLCGTQVKGSNWIIETCDWKEVGSRWPAPRESCAVVSRAN